MSVLIETSLGDIVIDLYHKKSLNASLNFLKLCKIKYYNGCLFYTVQKDYIALTGDQTNKGGGGKSVFEILGGNKYFDDQDNDLTFNCKGLVATSNPSPNKNTSEFFITLTDQMLPYLNKKHSIFGKVVEVFEVLDKINNALCNSSNKPLQQIVIRHTIIIADCFEDPKGLIVPCSSPIRKVEDDEALDPDFKFENKENSKLEEEAEMHQAKSRALGLYVIEDIPDADIAPPDNVLFVCKLNPVTQDEDLLGVFGRFGKIKSCQVIKDWKTNDSLQYAFIEFSNKEDCEEAFFKMDNVLLDGRRIHVDFSQSVAKLWADYRRKRNLDIAQTVMELEKTKKDPNKKETAKIEIKSRDRIDERYPILVDDAKPITLSSSESESDSCSSSDKSKSKSRSNSKHSKGRHKNKSKSRSRSRSDSSDSSKKHKKNKNDHRSHRR